ncbi:MAG: M20 family metallopeptidase [Verrucomicrobiae bacterium]|nr:M20 family metallopeptidase [Verrucomicrobiae bacterium]NNJ86662.1 M20 family metallopeptidase [Akkermansiaceae bacterium]
MDESILRERLIQLTRDLVLIESTDDRAEERSRCFQLIRNHLEEVPGFEIIMLEKNGYESLLALPNGVDRPEVLLCGHLDVVHHPEPDSYMSEVRDGRIYGPGAGDMKGQLAIMIELMRNMGREHPGLSVGMAITSDEERGGENGVMYLVEDEGVRCGEAVIPDGGSLNEIIVEEKGIIHLNVNAVGESAHAARPWLGVNALERLVKSLSVIHRYFDKQRPDVVDPDDAATHWFPTCSVTMLETANDSPNRIPEGASAMLDLRFVAPMTCDRLLQEIRSLLDDGVTATPIICAEPTHLAPDPEFARITEQMTGQPVALVRSSGGSDGRFFSGKKIPVLISRPHVGNLHGRDEWIDIDSMVSYFNICREYICYKCGCE